MSNTLSGSAVTVRKTTEGAPAGIHFNYKTAAWLVTASLLTACGGPATATNSNVLPTQTLPGGINESKLTPIAEQESAQFLQQAQNILGPANCIFPQVGLYRMPKATIETGVIQTELVIPGRTPGTATKVGLINNDWMPIDEAEKEDILNTAHALLHLCGPDKSLQPADRSMPLLTYADASAGVTTTVVPTTRYVNKD